MRGGGNEKKEKEKEKQDEREREKKIGRNYWFSCGCLKYATHVLEIEMFKFKKIELMIPPLQE